MAKMIKISDFSDSEQIGRYSDLFLDSKKEERFGVLIKQILAMPIFYGGDILGAVEIINKKDTEGQFRDKEPAFLQNIAELLGVALYNLQLTDPKVKRVKGTYLVSNGLITQNEMDRAKEESRMTKEPLQDILVKQYNISKEDVGKALEFFYRSTFVSFDKKTPIPGDLLKNLKKII